MYGILRLISSAVNLGRVIFIYGNKEEFVPCLRLACRTLDGRLSKLCF